MHAWWMCVCVCGGGGVHVCVCLYTVPIKKKKKGKKKNTRPCHLTDFHRQSNAERPPLCQDHFFWNLSLHFFFFFNTLFIPCRKFRSPYAGKVTTATRAALPIPISACSIFMCLSNGMAANDWDLSCMHGCYLGMWLHTWGLCGHRKRVCTESWLWEENPLPHQKIQPVSEVCSSDTSWMPYQLSYVPTPSCLCNEPTFLLRPQKTMQIVKERFHCVFHMYQLIKDYPNDQSWSDHAKEVGLVQVLLLAHK